MHAAEDFRGVSERVVREFVQTVVVVDDRAFTRDLPAAPGRLRSPFGGYLDGDTPAAGAEGAPPGAGAEPEAAAEAKSGAEASALRNSGLEGGQSATAAPPDDPGKPSRDDAARARLENLDASSLIRAFADAGVVCAVVEPETAADASAVSAAARAAERADIVVLDWFIHEGDSGGDTTKQVIEKILEQDADAGGRLRLIVIYTGEPIPAKVTDALEEVLKGRGSTPSRDGFALQAGPLRIVVLMKANQSGKAYEPEIERLRVDEAGLPSVVLQEFARLTSGLISNAAVRSLAVLRANTHALLANLDRRLDAAFLANRACQPSPEDSVLHLEELLTHEIGAMLSGFETGTVAGSSQVAGWIQARDSFEDPTSKKSVDKEALIRLVRDGDLKAVAGMAKNTHKVLTRMLQPAEHSDYDADAAYAVATSMIRRYGKQPEPILTAGVIVRRVSDSPAAPVREMPREDGPTDVTPPGAVAVAPANVVAPASVAEYLICIQPVCDSLRVDLDGRPFLFLPAEIAKAEEKQFNVVLESAPGKFLRLKHDAKAYLVRSIRFKPAAGESVVRARNEPTEASDPLLFTDATGGRYVWAGQMKAAHAQRLAQRVANELSRVGLNEPEWLRLASLGR